MSGSSLYLRSFLSIVSIFFILTFISQNVFAHARWSVPALDNVDSLIAPRNPSDAIKTGPCGGALRTITPKVLKSGDTVVVNFTETINHPGYFRIAFSPSADAGFDENVLVVKIPEVPATRNYTAEITLPNIQCTDCTLQLIQVMDKADPPNYYSCADIQLTTTGLPQPPGGDVVPPVDISNLAIAAGDSQANLSWINPVADFFQVVILQDTNSIAASPTNAIPYSVGDVIGSATVIYTGSGTSNIATTLMNNNTYYFKVFAYDTSLNYAPGVEANVTLAANPPNSPPVAAIIAEQATAVTTSVRQEEGDVIVQVTVNDSNPADTHTYNWVAKTDSRLVDLDMDMANSVFTFDPSGLVPGVYAVGVDVTDDGTPNMATSASLSIVVVAPVAIDSGAKSSGGGSLHSLSLFLCLILVMSRKIFRFNE